MVRDVNHFCPRPEFSGAENCPEKKPGREARIRVRGLRDTGRATRAFPSLVPSDTNLFFKGGS